MNKKIVVSEESQVVCSRSESIDSPKARYKHAACLHDRHIYIHGGIDRNLPYRDFWRYHIDLCTWEKLKGFGDIPPNLQSHTMTAHKDFLYVFGGNFWFDGSSETPLWTYELTRSLWRKPKLKMEVPSPCSRRCHSAVLYGHCLYIYGGYIDLKGSSEEFWVLDLENELWRLLKCPQSPGPRHSHSAIVHRDSMWLSGGMSGLKLRNDVWCWNFETMTWARIKQSGPDLVEHSAVSLGTQMLVYGGMRDGRPHQDLWLFSYETLMWQRLSHSRLPAVSHHMVLLIPPVDSTNDTADADEEGPMQHRLHTSKPENRIFKNRVLPFDTPHSSEGFQKMEDDTFEMENVNVCRSKLAWIENNAGVCQGTHLSLNLKHYAYHKQTLCDGINAYSVTTPADRPISMHQANSWDSGLSESAPLIQKRCSSNLQQTSGFINTAYLNTSQSNSSLEQNLCANKSGRPQCLRHGVHTGNFYAFNFEQVQLYSSRSHHDLSPQRSIVYNKQHAAVLQVEKAAELSPLVSSDLVIENIENITDSDSSVAELLPASRNLVLTTPKHLNSPIPPRKRYTKVHSEPTTTENYKDLTSTLFILGGRQLRKKDFAEVKKMNMWKFQIAL